MAGLGYALQLSCCSSQRPSVLPRLSAKASIRPSIGSKQPWKELLANPIFSHISEKIKVASASLVDSFVDQNFEFADQPLIPSQSNFAPIEEAGEAIDVSSFVDGSIPNDFPEGVYIRNGPNPLFGGLKLAKSIFGQSSHVWIEGEGMLHALYFTKDKDGQWNISYKNKQVETDTLEIEKRRNKPSFLPAVEGDSAAVLSAYLLNWLRFGSANKDLSNTSVFEHSGKFYSTAENHLPQEIDILTLETKKRYWDVNGAWAGPFTSHPKKVPGTGELVIMGVYPLKPYFQVGVISADGKKLIHKVDVNLDRCCLGHEMGITTRHNVILDFPPTLDIHRLMSGGPLLKYEKGAYARIGIMPRYGETQSVKWFQVKPSCAFHILNCYEQRDEVVVLACRSECSILPGPDFGLNKFEWFSERFKNILDEKSHEESFLARVYEWRLNTKMGNVLEANLTGNQHSMDFPMIHEEYCGRMNSFAYTQIADPIASSKAGMSKFGGLAKLHFEERRRQESCDEEDLIKVEHHEFPSNTFCTGAAFVAKPGGVSEDDGWIITYVHDEDSNKSHVYVVDAKNFTGEAVAKIELPRRVPYGFHGTFLQLLNP